MNAPAIFRRTLPLLAAIALLGAAACGEDDASEPDNGSGTAATPSTTHTVVMTDNKFNIRQMAVPANQAVTVTVQNDGAAIHNWHVLNVKDADGKEVTTELLRGDQSETVTFTITEPGTYDFRCDTHPVEMKGKITVQ